MFEENEPVDISPDDCLQEMVEGNDYNFNKSVDRNMQTSTKCIWAP